jgi:hypothetical protein
MERMRRPSKSKDKTRALVAWLLRHPDRWKRWLADEPEPSPQDKMWAVKRVCVRGMKAEGLICDGTHIRDVQLGYYIREAWMIIEIDRLLKSESGSKV